MFIKAHSVSKLCSLRPDTFRISAGDRGSYLYIINFVQVYEKESTLQVILASLVTSLFSSNKLLKLGDGCFMERLYSSISDTKNMSVQ